MIWKWDGSFFFEVEGKSSMGYIALIDLTGGE